MVGRTRAKGFLGREFGGEDQPGERRGKEDKTLDVLVAMLAGHGRDASLLWASLAVSSLGEPRALLGINRFSTLANHVSGIY